MQRHVSFFVALAALALFIGCSEQTTSEPDATPPDDPAEAAAHAHGDEGPHGGHLIEIGKYHGEIDSDHDSHTVTIYLLDGQVKELTEPIDAKVVISVFKLGEYTDYELSAGEGVGEFTSEDDKLCHALDHSNDVHARVKVTVGDEEFVGRYEHESHGEEDSH